MTLFDTIRFQTPVIRVKDKEANINFFREVCGFKLLTEENSLAFFCALKDKETRFSLEESPEYRTRAARGNKKLNKLIFKTSRPQDIEALLAQGHPVQQVFKGKQGYAFEAYSPQGDLILLHAEDNYSLLEPTKDRTFRSLPDFKGLWDYQLDAVILNVLDDKLSQDFYQGLPLTIDVSLAQGEDLASDPAKIWDLEILEFTVAQDDDLRALGEFFAQKQAPYFLDKKECILVVSDPSNIELWFQK
ncbi:CppA N-terminal domain-containing protein [Streptococcus cuniculipharyngis]|nr:CppA N-terminal domain-containing protein [Streptococcus cuniculipharyngis]